MRRRCLAALFAGLLGAGCVDHAPPVVGVLPPASFAELVVPKDLNAPAAVLDRHQRGWAELRAGRLQEASGDFTDALKRAPAFYPAEAGLGDVALAMQQYAQAAAHFDAALARNTAYVPALLGRVDASLALKDEAAAIDALERLVAIDPGREDAKSRLNVLRVKAVERELTMASAARASNDLEAAHAAFARALVMSPSSAVILRGLVDVELAAGQLDEALTHARAAVSADATDAESCAMLGEVLEAQGLHAAARDAFERAVALDPRPEWRASLDAARRQAAAAALPAEYRAIPTAASVTRAQVAALVANHLKGVIDDAPKRAAVVITDLRGNWAASWILAVARTGIMDALPNHTFQPGATVARTDLARVVAQVLGLLAPSHQQEAVAWRAARPRFADVPAEHLAYPAVALAVTVGAMTADSGHFGPTRPASGADLVAAVARLERLAAK
jgi:tetratricopeptide (TPR) repeat protein